MATTKYHEAVQLIESTAATIRQSVKPVRNEDMALLLLRIIPMLEQLQQVIEVGELALQVAQQRNQTAEELIAQLQAQLEQMENENETQKDEIFHLSIDKNSLSAQISQLNIEKGLLQSSVTSLNNTISSVNQQLTTANSTISTQANRITDLTTKLATQTANANALRNALSPIYTIITNPIAILTSAISGTLKVNAGNALALNLNVGS